MNDLIQLRSQLDHKLRYKYALEKFLILPVLPILATISGLAATLMMLEGLWDRPSWGGLFYLETRWTQGKPFSIWKFRTTYPGSQAPGTVGRVTRTGLLLKKYYLDELPQLLNILFGDMSFVGPRPNVPDKAKREIEQEGMRSKFVLRAGLTGLVQVYKKEAQNREIYQRIEEEYLGKIIAAGPLQVIWIDLDILWKTIATVLRGEGL